MTGSGGQYRRNMHKKDGFSITGIFPMSKKSLSFPKSGAWYCKAFKPTESANVFLISDQRDCVWENNDNVEQENNVKVKSILKIFIWVSINQICLSIVENRQLTDMFVYFKRNPLKHS